MKLNDSGHTVGRIFYRSHGKITGVLVHRFANILCLGIVLDQFYRRPYLVKRLLHTHGLQYVGINPIKPPLWRLYGSDKRSTEYRMLAPVVKRNLSTVSQQTTHICLEDPRGMRDFPINVPLYTKPSSKHPAVFTFSNYHQFLANEFNDLDYIFDRGFWYVGQYKSDSSVPNGYYIRRLRLADAIRIVFRDRVDRKTQI